MSSSADDTERDRTLRVRQLLGPTPQPEDVAALRKAADAAREAVASLRRVVHTASPAPHLRTRIVPRLEEAANAIEREWRAAARSREPLEVGQVVQLVPEGPLGVCAVDVVFHGVDDGGFILLQPPVGRKAITEHRVPPTGPHGLMAEERHRVEAWVAARKAAGLTLQPKKTRRIAGKASVR